MYSTPLALSSAPAYFPTLRNGRVEIIAKNFMVDYNRAQDEAKLGSD